MNLPRLLACSVFYFSLTGMLIAQESAQSPAKQQVEQLLTAQARAWNQGDLDGFMQGYANLPTLRFASGGTVTYGWQETLDHYKRRYPDRAAMGTLAFSELDTTVLSADAALVFGRWQLRVEKDSPGGLFTLLLRHTEAGWKIVADHTSAAAPPTN